MALKALDYEKINPTTATGLTGAKITTKVLMVQITVESQIVHIRMDGTDPTATDGLVIPAGNWPPYEVWGRPNLDRLKMIDSAAGASTVHVVYFGTGD